MGGTVFFAHENWSARSSAVHFAMEFVAERLPPGPQKDSIQELADNNVLLLDLRDPEQRLAVDILADELAPYVEDVVQRDPDRVGLRDYTEELIEIARREQRHVDGA